MDIRKLQRAIVDGLEDVKAQNIVVFNTEHLSPLFERVIIASGTSNRQTKALAASVRDAVKGAGLPPPRVEGEANGEWIIVDCGPAVVHVMQPTFRDYYHLEELWGEKPVKMKLQGAAAGLPKAAPAPAAERARPVRVRAVPDDASPARKAAVRGPSNRSSSTGTGGTAVKRTSTRTAEIDRAKPAPRAASAKRTAAAPRPAAPKRAAAPRASVPSRTAAPAARGVTRTVGVKSSAAKKAASSAAPTRRKAPTKT